MLRQLTIVFLLVTGIPALSPSYGTNITGPGKFEWPKLSDWDPRGGSIYLGGGLNAVAFPLLWDVDNPLSAGLQTHIISDLHDRMVEFNLSMNFGSMNVTNFTLSFLNTNSYRYPSLVHGPGIAYSLLAYKGSAEMIVPEKMGRQVYLQKAPSLTYKVGWKYEKIEGVDILFAVQPTIPLTVLGDSYFPVGINFSVQLIVPLID